MAQKDWQKRYSLCILSFLFIVFFSSIVLANREEWREEKSTHFIVYYKDAPLEFIQETIKTAERCYDEMTEILGFTRFDFWLWEKRAKIYIYSDAQDYQRNTGQPSWSGGSANYRDKIIYTYPQAAGFFDSLLPHELGHIIFREFVGFKSNIPLWSDEGVACYMEKAKRYGSEKIVLEAIKTNRFIPLDELTKISSVHFMSPDKALLFYAESISIVKFLIYRYEKYKFSDFCRALRDGDSIERALSKNYAFRNLKELESALIKYLNE